MMKKRLIIASVLAIILSAAGLAQASGTVRIATNSPYRPMEYTTPSGDFAGFDIDLGNALCKQANLKCTWVNQSWNGIIPGLIAHRYDAIMSSMMITPQRKKHVLFSNGYLFLGSAFFVSAESSIHKIDKSTLKGKKIGVQRGTVQDNYVTQEYGSIATIKRYQNADGVAQDMEVGRLDMAFLNQVTGANTLTKKHPKKYRQAGKMLGKNTQMLSHSTGIALRKNDTELARKFNNALAALKKNGKYKKIYNKYFSDLGE